MNFSLADLIFYLAAAVVLLSGGYAVATRNIVRAVFSLLATFFGVAVLYALLAADFLAVVQVLIYVGGILVLLLFAVMLTANLESARLSNPAAGRLLGLAAALAAAIILVPLALHAPWAGETAAVAQPLTARIGSELLGRLLLPFEAISVVLLGVVIGAVVVARFRRPEESSEEVQQ